MEACEYISFAAGTRGEVETLRPEREPDVEAAAEVKIGVRVKDSVALIVETNPDTETDA